MAKNFFEKLNTLVQSQINDVLRPMETDDMSKSRRKALARNDVRGGLEKNVSELRKRVDDALVYQDELQSRADKLYQEIAEWDEKADKAVDEGRESDAKYAIRRMQQSQRELELTESDLEQHRYLTQELISQVNTLDSIVGQAESDAQTDDASAPVDNRVEELTRNISQRLDTTRRKLQEMVDNYTGNADFSDFDPDATTGDQHSGGRMYDAGEVVDETPEPEHRTSHPVSNRDVDDDYASRISRLSKPGSDDE